MLNERTGRFTVRLRHQAKKGIHFIIASVVIWLAVMAVHLMDMPILTKNLIAFCCPAPLLPLAYMVPRVHAIHFEGKGQPLTTLGLSLLHI